MKVWNRENAIGLDRWITEQNASWLRLAIAFNETSAENEDGRSAVITYGRDDDGNKVVESVELSGRELNGEA